MVDEQSTENLIERLKEEARSCGYPTDVPGIKKRYRDTALILFKEDRDDGTLRNYLSFGSRRSSSVSQYGNTPIIIRRSRSSNGELATVVEQVPTLQGRSTKSSYTLLDAAEKSKYTDSDDESYFQDSRCDSDESFAIKQNHDEYSRLTADSTDSYIVKDEGTPVASEADIQSQVSVQGRNSSISEQQSQDHHTQTDLSHHDSPAYECSDIAQSGSVQPSGDEVIKIYNKRASQNEREQTSELKHVEEYNANQVFDADSKRDSAFSQDSEHNTSSQLPIDVSHPQDQTLEERKTLQTFPQDTCDTTSGRPSEGKASSPEPDHAAILRKFVQQPSLRKRSLKGDEVSFTNTSTVEKQEREVSEGLKLVELKIVESDEHILSHADIGISEIDPDKSLTTSDIPHLCDDSDVVFIDAGSPFLSRTKLAYGSLSGCGEELIYGHKERREGTTSVPDNPVETSTTPQTSEVGTPSNPQKAIPQSSEFPGTIQSLESDRKDKKEEPSKEDVFPRRRHSSTNSFRDLPIRSPTPPRRKPEKSPRTPRLREKVKQRHSSLALTSDEETQEKFVNGTRSASPTSKGGDFRFFSFSLKKEKSKSATYLGSKRNKERVKLTSVKLSLDDQGTGTGSQFEEGHIESPGKRVGVRSMMIDGTIKRNFIVIHPSDDSDTIGLAPKSPHKAQKEVFGNTPEAFSSVKTHITTPTKGNPEVTKQVHSQGGLKEELTDIPENIRSDSKASLRSSFNFSQISRSLRIKQNKKNVPHMSLKGSHSLSSEPDSLSPSSPQILYKSPPPLSVVDCDSSSALTQRLECTEDSRTVSRLCVVM